MRPTRSILPIALLSALFLAPAPAAAAETPPPSDTMSAPERIAEDLTVGVERMREGIPHQSFTAPSNLVPQGLNRDSSYSVAIIQRFSWPVPEFPQSSGYGPRTCSEGPCSTFHQGIDLTPGAGTPIKAVTAGTIRSAGWLGHYGYAVVIDHVVDGQAVSTLYGHMEEGSIQVRQGQSVKRGSFIGRVGDTGRSYGAHLHFEVHVGGSPVNPGVWMDKVEALEYPAD